MALSRSHRRRERGVDYWPGFVDAMATLLLSIIFLLSFFVVAQTFLSQEISGRDTVLNRLNQQIVELSELLALEKSAKAGLEELAATTRSTLSVVEDDRERLANLAAKRQAEADAVRSKAESLEGRIETEKEASQRAMAQVENLNQQIAAFRRQIGSLESALDTSEQRDRESQTQISDLGRRLNLALAQKVQELARYRSDFFGRLREILSQRSDIRVVGDRFVFQSEVLFEAGVADVNPVGRQDLDKLAEALLQLEKEIPADIPWVLRVDGHTDQRPIQTARFQSNWELSSFRAISVLRYLVSKGVSPQRVAAAGFGEFQPLEAGSTDEAFKRNRRIELKLTER